MRSIRTKTHSRTHIIVQNTSIRFPSSKKDRFFATFIRIAVDTRSTYDFFETPGLFRFFRIRPYQNNRLLGPRWMRVRIVTRSPSGKTRASDRNRLYTRSFCRFSARFFYNIKYNECVYRVAFLFFRIDRLIREKFRNDVGSAARALSDANWN